MKRIFERDGQDTWLLVVVLPLTNCVALGKSLRLSGLEFSLL